ncbi:hypothetical protein FDECE_8455 [Fusarium decemcellulare]|nr:hypothetical protein FDECE_8455 [Fusarium decemcellulare]
MVRRTSKSKSKSSVSRPAGTIRIVMPSSSRAPPAPTNSTASTETVTEEDVNKLSIADLTLDTPLIPLRPKRRVPRTPFHFLSLPAEVRIQIYTYFYDDVDETIDLSPLNYKRYHKKLGLVRVCRQVHDEATFAFYSTRTFRIFSTFPGRYFHTKKPLIARLKPQQRRCLASLQLRLGPGWNAPPKGWAVGPKLGLSDCVNVVRLKVFVEIDPTHKDIKDFHRLADDFYPSFSKNLLTDLLESLPSVEVIEFDGYPSVRKSGLMMKGLMEVATLSGLTIEWGPERGWTDSMDDDNGVSDTAAAFPEGLPYPGYENGLLAMA